LKFHFFSKADAAASKNIFFREHWMKKRLILFVCLTVCLVGAGGVFAEKNKSATTLPPVIAQVCGQANTVIMWHDIDNDGQANYKATYVFKDGKLHQMEKSPTSQEELGFVIRRR
jgi:hypothetical protein